MKSRYSPKNSYKISSGAVFESKAVVRNTKILVESGNTVRLAETCRLHNLTISIKGKNNKLIVHEGTFLVGNIELHGDNNYIEIGKHTRLTGTSLIAHHGTKIIFGERCMVAPDTDVRTTDSHPIFNADGEWINRDKDVIIHDRVWLARYVSILKGAVIESDCVVGYKSLVVNKIPKNSICAGIPAKVVKSGITWTRERDPDLHKRP